VPGIRFQRSKLSPVSHQGQHIRIDTWVAGFPLPLKNEARTHGAAPPVRRIMKWRALKLAKGTVGTAKSTALRPPEFDQAILNILDASPKTREVIEQFYAFYNLLHAFGMSCRRLRCLSMIDRQGCTGCLTRRGLTGGPRRDSACQAQMAAEIFGTVH
jgi:hypothetical protein